MGKWDRRNFGKAQEAQAQGRTVSPVVERVQAAANKLGIEGTVVTFGSHANSLSNASSDCDVTFMPREDVRGEAALQLLERFAEELPSHGFKSIVRIFQASIPLIKAVDQGGIEIDLCVCNHLGVNNSRLVAAYCQLDIRVGEVCRAVKQWAKGTELVGSSDGHLNSYAYTLLTLYYLMSCRPPVVPNLQDLAGQFCDPVPVVDRKWGREMTWDCRFWDDLHLLPKSQNTDTIESLLKGFFRYYTETFDWSTQAVSIRLALTTKQGTVPKFSLGSPVTNDGWYIEDPFDLRHNLGSNCVKEGRTRILGMMTKALRSLEQGGMMAFNSLCARNSLHYLLKCRVHPEKVSLDDFMAAVTGVDELKEPFTVHFPSSQGPRGREVADAFLIFKSEECRRKVHQLNETALGEWQLRLMPCSSWALEDAMGAGEYKEVPVTPNGPAQAAQAAQADEAVAEKVRSGLRVATDVEEVQQLIELARTHRLKHEEQMGLKRLERLKQNQASAAPAGREAAAQQHAGRGSGSSVAYQ